MSNHHPMKPPILIIFNLLAASRDCHGFGISIPPRLSPLSRHSLNAVLEDLNEQNDFAGADLDVLRAEIEEMGGDPSFLIDPRNPLINKPPKEQFPTKEDGGDPTVLRVPTSFLGSHNMHPLISKALKEENLCKEDYNEQNDSVEDLEDLRAEIEAMGGDPSFLPSIQREPLINSKQVVQREPMINSKQVERFKVGGDDNYNEQNDSMVNMEDLRAEIEAMGGDPSFLPMSAVQREPMINSKQVERLKVGGDDNCNEQNDSMAYLEDLRAEIEAMGGDPSFLPMSAVQREPMINSKQVERFKVGGDDNCNEQNDSVPDLVSLQAEEIEAMGGDPWFLPSQQRDPSINKRLKEEGLSEEDELLEIEGDPAFLGNYKEQNDPSRDLELLLSEIEEMGGDPSFL